MATSNKNFKVKNGLDVSGAATASSFVKTGGAANEFLKADGSISEGGSAQVSATPPSSPASGDLWYNSETGQTFIYYDSYWVENIAGVAGPAGPTGATPSAPFTLTQSSNNANYPLTISSANEQGGGTGWSDILKLINSKSGATNPNKHIRMNASGGIEIVNSAYTDTIFYLADNGNLSELGTVNGVNLSDSGWIAVSSFSNSFTAPTAVAYRKLNDVVYLRGNVANGTANATAFTLPVGYRPSVDVVVPVQQYGTSNINYVTVSTSGDVTPNATSGWLSSVVFPVG